MSEAAAAAPAVVGAVPSGGSPWTLARRRLLRNKVAMVMLGAFATNTGIVGLDALIQAMADSIPPYRTQHIAANERALSAGAELLPANEQPAWEAARV